MRSGAVPGTLADRGSQAFSFAGVSGQQLEGIIGVSELGHPLAMECIYHSSISESCNPPVSKALVESIILLPQPPGGTNEKADFSSLPLVECHFLNLAVGKYTLMQPISSQWCSFFVYIWGMRSGECKGRCKKARRPSVRVGVDVSRPLCGTFRSSSHGVESRPLEDLANTFSPSPVCTTLIQSIDGMAFGLLGIVMYSRY